MNNESCKNECTCVLIMVQRHDLYGGLDTKDAQAIFSFLYLKLFALKLKSEPKTTNFVMYDIPDKVQNTWKSFQRNSSKPNNSVYPLHPRITCLTEKLLRF